MVFRLHANNLRPTKPFGFSLFGCFICGFIFGFCFFGLSIHWHWWVIWVRAFPLRIKWDLYAREKGFSFAPFLFPLEFDQLRTQPLHLCEQRNPLLPLHMLELVKWTITYELIVDRPLACVVGVPHWHLLNSSPSINYMSQVWNTTFVTSDLLARLLLG